MRSKAAELRFVTAGPERVSEDLRTLRAFKMERWGAGPHTDAFLAFHEAFAAELARRGMLCLTRLMLGAKTISVLYDVRVLAGTGRHREYKRDLCPDGVTLFCYQVVRAPLLRTLYGAHGFLKQLKPGSRAGPCESCS